MTAPTSRDAARPGLVPHGWLLDRISLYVKRPAESIDPGVPLAEYGLDSVCALGLCGDLEEEFGLAVEPTLLWDHPTLERLTARLVELPDALRGRP
ncbi:acyl carrier protein [Kitasatospora sp. RB6PN24]|uniref:acyl carrier protein n=1 Tax=Kitasatospora humi TaxID=2893891 RepID=UPI001E4D33AC|nr:acyl carrier protein [Kitasatospora humi]MCC9312013.1 acyl carrier protein [Kitasatospora humi]